VTPATFSVYRYRLPLVESVNLHDHYIDDREGYLVCFEGADGAKGWGDCAPLPWFSQETLLEVAVQLEQVLARDGSWRHGVIDNRNLCPSVCLALETAMLNLRAAEAGRPMAQCLSADARTHVEVNSLLIDDADAGLGSSPAVKIKVGRKSIDEDVARVIHARELIGPDAVLFADANRAWSVEEAERFFNQVEACKLLYIEEPLKEPQHVSGLSMPVALDESLLEYAPEDVAEWSNVVAYVAKPTLIGSLERVFAWARQAEQLGIGVTISAAFESGVGIYNLAHIAAALPASHCFAGLDTVRWLAEDVLSPRIPLAEHRIAVDTPFDQHVTVDETKLECVAHG
jgi:O-succinylbenzoate synthase